MTIATLDNVQFIHTAGYGFGRIDYRIEYMIDQQPVLIDVDADEIEAINKSRKDIVEGKVFSEKKLASLLAS